jgi:hypothetical protein
MRHDRVQTTARWDDDTVSGNDAFQSLEQSRCPLVKK